MVEGPRLSSWTLPDLLDGSLDDLLAQDHHEATRFAGLDLKGRSLHGLHFIECLLQDVSADDAVLRGTRLISTRLEGLTATMVKASRSTLREVELASSRLGAVEMYESKLQSVTVADCKLEWLNLRGADLQDVVFRSCHFGDLDVSSARARRIRFEACSIGTLSLDGASLSDVDLRDARITVVSSVDGLRGTTLTEGQVLELLPTFAERFGFTIDDSTFAG